MGALGVAILAVSTLAAGVEVEETGRRLEGGSAVSTGRAGGGQA